MKTPEQLSKAREYQRRYRELNRERINADERLRRSSDEAKFKRFVYNEEHRDQRLAYQKAWKLARGYKRPPEKKSERLRIYQRNWRRAQYIRDFEDKEAIAARIIARVEAAIPSTLPRDARAIVINSMVEAIYRGEIRSTSATSEAQRFIKAHFREATDWRTVSLDDVLGDEGFTRGMALGAY